MEENKVTLTLNFGLSNRQADLCDDSDCARAVLKRGDFIGKIILSQLRREEKLLEELRGSK